MYDEEEQGPRYPSELLNSDIDTKALLSYLDVNADLARLITRLKNQYWNPKSEKLEQLPGTKPLVTKDAGLQWISNRCMSFFMTSAVANDLKQVEVVALARAFIDDIADTFQVPAMRKKFGIEDGHTARLIADIIFESCYLNLKRSVNAGDRRLLDGNVKTLQHLQVSAKQLQGGNKAFWNPFKKQQ